MGKLKIMENIIKCKLCGKEFAPQHWNAKYCSDECRKTAYKQQIATYQSKYKENGYKPLRSTEKKKNNVEESAVATECQPNKNGISINDYVKEIGETRALFKELESVVNKLYQKCEEHNIKHESLEKERILLDHQLESYKNIPSDEIMAENNTKRYGILKERRIEKIFSKGIYDIISVIPKNPEQQFMNRLAYQEELNEKYDKQKEWNTDKWKISGIPRAIKPTNVDKGEKND